MRTRTYVLSLIAHVIVVGWLMVSHLMATTDLPDPPRLTALIIVRPALPTLPPPARTARPQLTPTVNADAAPIVAPDGVHPELRDLPNELPISADAIAGFGSADLGVLAGAEPAPPPARRAEPVAPVRPGGVIRRPEKIHDVAPAYPDIARAARITGTVILEALIAEDGTVREVKVLRSVALLDAAAIDAVRQWRFTPTLLNGTPVPVLMTVTVSFNLN